MTDFPGHMARFSTAHLTFRKLLKCMKCAVAVSYLVDCAISARPSIVSTKLKK